MFPDTKSKQNEFAIDQFLGNGGAIDLFSKAGELTKPTTSTNNTKARTNIDPGTIGAEITAEMNTAPKEVIRDLSTSFPINGMEPETRAKLNLAARLSDRVVDDAAAYTQAAGKIAHNMAAVYHHQGQHQKNMMEADLKTKKTDVAHLEHVQHWQTETQDLVAQARQQFAGIQFAANCL